MKGVLLLTIVLPMGIRAEPAPTVPDFSEYRIVVDNNVFDPDRGRPAPPPRPAMEAVRAPDTLDLIGVLIVDGIPTILCRGSEAGWNGEFAVGDQVADLQIVRVDTRAVTLANLDGSEQIVPVGTHLQRRDGRWSAASRSTESTRSSAAADGAAASPGSPGGSAVDDVLRRLRERRMKELNP